MSIENPAIPLSQIEEGSDTYAALTVGTNAAGVALTARKALGLSAVWRGVNLIAGDVGRHSFRVYRYEGESGLKADPKHQAARVMRKPNEYMTPFTFRQTLQAHALIHGNGFAAIERDGGAAPLALLPLDPEQTYPLRIGGELWYISRLSSGRGASAGQFIKLPAADVLHIKGLGFDGLCGYPVFDILRDTIGAAVAARDYGARYFKNDASPGVVIEVPASMKEPAIKNVRESWADLHQGVDKSHRPAILREGMKLVPFSKATARDAQLLENRDFDAREIGNVLGVPPHKVGDPSRTAYNSLESENQAYQEDTLDRWFVTWEQECDAKLLTEDEKQNETHACKFDPRPITRVSLAERGAYYSTAINAGWLSVDDVRGYENLNPLPNGAGQVYRTPVNLKDAAAPADNPDPALEPKTPPDPTTPPDTQTEGQ